jgi:hypothetical protein
MHLFFGGTSHLQIEPRDNFSMTVSIELEEAYDEHGPLSDQRSGVFFRGKALPPTNSSFDTRSFDLPLRWNESMGEPDSVSSVNEDEWHYTIRYPGTFDEPEGTRHEAVLYLQVWDGDYGKYGKEYRKEPFHGLLHFDNGLVIGVSQPRECPVCHPVPEELAARVRKQVAELKPLTEELKTCMRSAIELASAARHPPTVVLPPTKH